MQDRLRPRRVGAIGIGKAAGAVQGDTSNHSRNRPCPRADRSNCPANHIDQPPRLGRGGAGQRRIERWLQGRRPRGAGPGKQIGCGCSRHSRQDRNRQFGRGKWGQTGQPCSQCPKRDPSSDVGKLGDGGRPVCCRGGTDPKDSSIEEPDRNHLGQGHPEPGACPRQRRSFERPRGGIGAYDRAIGPLQAPIGVGPKGGVIKHGCGANLWPTVTQGAPRVSWSDAFHFVTDVHARGLSKPKCTRQKQAIPPQDLERKRGICIPSYV